MNLRSVDPSTGELIGSYPEMSFTEVNNILESVQHSFTQWKGTGIEERSERMLSLVHILRAGKQEYSELMAREMGKPVDQGIAEVEKCASVCEYYMENAPSFLATKPIHTDASRSFVSFQPLGIVLAVMPWNFPFWQVLRFAVPTLMAGNGGVLKHASNVQGSALAIEALFREAGFPENLFRNLVLTSRNVAPVIKHPLVKAVTLTGSTPAGKAVARTAASVLKKTVLELGGSDPYLILEDADLDQAVSACVTGRMNNTGQSCIAAKRLIVVDSLKESFEKSISKAMKSQTMGNPLEGPVDLGPMVNHEARELLHSQVERSVKMGARLLIGGSIPVGPGAFYPPTVLTDVVPGMPAFEEELFGPVAVIIAASNDEEAVELANRTPFGLGAAVFTSDSSRGEQIAVQKLQAGSCFVNDYVRSDPRLPFGGIKESGYGRELSEFGIHEFVNIKTVYVK